MRRTRLLAPLLFLASIGFGGDDADAAFLCVNKNPCAGGVGTNFTTIEAAFEAAEQQNNETDTVLIDDNGGTPYVESPSYTDTTQAVHVIGDGVGQTIIEGPGPDSSAVTLINANSTIKDLTIYSPSVSNGAALRWTGTASNIQVLHTGSTEASINGMVAEGNAVLEDSTVSINGFGLFTVVGNASGVKVIDSSLRGGGRGISVGDGTLALERSTVTSTRSPIEVGNGGDLTVLNAVLRMTGTLPADGAIYLLSGAEGIVRHATVIGAGTGRGVLIDATSGDSKVTMFDSIIDGFVTSLLCAGTAPNTATLGVSYSNWTEPAQTEDTECADTFGGVNDNVNEPVYVSTNPLFPDFRLKAPSPLIDAGGPGDPLTQDLVGAPRVIDGDGNSVATSDMGAYEYQRQPPSAAISAPETATVGQPASFSATGSSDPDPGDALTYSWDFGDGGTGEGFAPQHSFATGGTFEVKVTVADPTGLSDSATAQVQVPASAPTEPGKPNNPKKPKKPKNPKALATISELRAVPKRIRRGKGLPKLIKGLKRPGFQFKLSKKGDVALTLVRCKGKRGCKRRVQVPGSATFKASAGENTIKFRGRLTGPKLRKGRYRATLKAAGNALSTAFTLLP